MSIIPAGGEGGWENTETGDTWLLGIHWPASLQLDD